MAAATSGHIEAVREAIALDPDVQAVTATQETLMHAAARASVGSTTPEEICKVIQFLADRGVALDVADANGVTPLMIVGEVPLNDPVALLTKLIRASGAAPREPKASAKTDEAQ
jgi:hypothetical protein